MEINDECTKIKEKISKIYRYNCVRCNLIFNEIDLLKSHYYEKHIVLIENVTTSKKTKNLEKIASNIKAKRQRTIQNKASDEENDESNNISLTNSSSFHTNSSITIKRRKIEAPEEEVIRNDTDNDKRMNELTDDEMKKYNLEDIDETELINEIGDGVYNKKRELLAGKVVWAQWRNIMWPGLIVKVTSRTAKSISMSGLKIHIRYYEMRNKLGSVFKMDPSKVELFYKCKEHESYKVLGAINPGQRKEFFISYTNALKDYIEYKKNNIKVNSETVADKIKDEQPLSSTPLVKDKKYTVLGKHYTIDEVKELASKTYSNEQIEENNKRKQESSNLMDLVLSEDCSVRHFSLSLFSVF